MIQRTLIATTVTALLSSALAWPAQAFDQSDVVTGDLRRIYLNDLTIYGATHQPGEVFAGLVTIINTARIRPVVSKTYPLRDIAQAQADLAAIAQSVTEGNVRLHGLQGEIDRLHRDEVRLFQLLLESDFISIERLFDLSQRQVRQGKKRTRPHRFVNVSDLDRASQQVASDIGVVPDQVIPLQRKVLCLLRSGPFDAARGSRVVARAKAVLEKLEATRTATGGIAAGLGDLPLFAALAAEPAPASPEQQLADALTVLCELERQRLNHLKQLIKKANHPRLISQLAEDIAWLQIHLDTLHLRSQAL